MTDSSSAGKRTIEVTGTLQMQDATLDQRLKAIENKIASLKAPGALEWVLDLVKALLPGVVLAVVGYALNDTVSHAFQERQLQLDAIKEMKTLTADLQQSNLTRDQAQAKAAELASFGEYAVPFFINVEEIGNEYGVAGAVEGLRMVARSKPKPVCDAVTAVIRNRTGLYKWQTHSSALEVIGAVHCPDALPDVGDYQANLDLLSTMPNWVGGSKPDPRELAKLKDQVKETLDLLNRPVPQIGRH